MKTTYNKSLKGYVGDYDFDHAPDDNERPILHEFSPVELVSFVAESGKIRLESRLEAHVGKAGVFAGGGCIDIYRNSENDENLI